MLYAHSASQPYATFVAACPIMQFSFQPRILLVEDNLMLQRVHVSFLEKMGYDVTCVDSGEAFLQESVDHYDAVLMDIDLPGINGICATQTLFNNNSKIKTPVIACTSHAASEMKDTCLSVGMVDYLQKPLSMARIENCLKSHVAQGVSHD